MPDFSEIADESKRLAGEHPDIANKGIEQAGQLADEKTGGRFGGQTEQAEQKVEGFLGTDSQDGQDPQAGNQ